VRIRCVLAVVDLGVLLWFLTGLRLETWTFDDYRPDLDVYRLGVRTWLAGGDLYGTLPDMAGGGNLPFTYPPIAAALLVPFGLLSFPVAGALLTLLSVAAVAVVLVLMLRELAVPRPLLVAAAVLPAALVLEPIRTTLYYGQVNALLMALVALDCLARRPRWPRGALVGLAAAVKLVPGLFVPFFLLRGDRRSALTAGVSFLLVTGVGFLLDGRSSLRFWTHTVFHPDRMTEPGRRTNQSITGLLARLGVEGTAPWLVLAVALLGLTALAVRRALALGQPALAVALCGLGTVPVVPVAWCHHWVWCAPALVCLAVVAWRRRDRILAGITTAATAVFVLSPHWWLDQYGPWTVGPLLLSTLYLAVAVLVLGYLARVPTGAGTASDDVALAGTPAR
jgi:alpha-1,2-mannosyltransferase